MTQNYIGVDLSRDWLDVFTPGNGHGRIANTAPALQQFLATLSADDLLVFEATSLCDGLLMRLATACGQPFHRLNPLHGWHFARSLNLPKTDRVDAAMLVRLGAERRLAPSAGFDATRAEMAELMGRRDQLKRMQTQEKNRLSKASSRTVSADIRASLRALALRIRRADAAIDGFLEGHRRLRDQIALLESVPSIGRVTSVTLLSLMPEIGACDRHQIASLGGLAPRARESGKWQGQRHIGDGRRHVRKALYMAALSAIGHQRLCPDLVTRMRDRGKPGKVIAIAVARKILTIANAVIRDQSPYRAAA